MPAPKHSFEEQEQLILDAAAQSILESSLIDFKMSSIAKNAGLSMGSVYKHIQSKEDVLVALSVRLDQQASRIIGEVLALPYPLPAKIVVLNLIPQEVMYKYPFSHQLLTMLNSKDLLAKASEKWLSKLSLLSMEIRNRFKSALEEAVNNDELMCNPDEKEALIEEFIFLQWAVNIGYPQILNYPHDTHINQAETNVNVPLTLEHPLLKATIRMTNSYPWKEPITRHTLEKLEQEMIRLGFR